MKIHQIWYQGIDQAPEKYNDNRLSWRQNHPKADFQTWDAVRVKKLIQEHYPSWEEFFDSLPLMIQKIDVMKVFIMYHHGGVYCDMDSESLRPLDGEIMDYQGLTVSRVHTKWMEHLATSLLKGFENRHLINNGIMISPEPRHPFWIYYLERLRLEIGDPPRGRNAVEKLLGDSMYVMNTTGPLFWTVCLNDWMRKNPDTVRVLHYSYLEPIFGMDPPEKQVPLPWSYVKHEHASSWCQQDIGMIRFYYQWFRPYWEMWAIVLVVLVLALTFLSV